MANDEATGVATRFDEIISLHGGLQRALKQEFRYETMSPVQSMVLNKMPITKDLLVRAETGTGKTLGFLLPTIDQILQKQTVEDFRKGKSCKALIISPTRELAMQIAEEANRLCSRLPLQVRCFVGGENRRNNVRDIESRRIDILVATPGRLEDLLESERLLKEQMQGLQALVLDEADTLLEMGFRDALTRIIEHLPEERRTMLFSATLSKEVKGVVRIAFRNEHELIDTIGHDKKPHVPERIRQSYLMAPSNEHPVMLRRLLAWHLRGEGRLEGSQPAKVEQKVDSRDRRDGNRQRSRHGQVVDHPGKVIVFFPTTKATMLYADLFRASGHRDIFEIHSKRDQKQRQRVADRFREARGPAILFTSDVSARGVDYPGVTLVVQMGASAGTDQYVHRSGRTGRAGQSGRAIAIYSQLERDFANVLSELGLRHDPELEQRLIAVAADATVKPKETTDEAGSDVTETKILSLPENELRRERLAELSFEQAKEDLDAMAIEEAFTAYLGFYVGRVADLHIRNKNHIIDEAGHFAKGFGLSEAPQLSSNFLNRIGFNENSLRKDAMRDSRSNRFERRGSFSSGGNDRRSSFGGFNRDNGGRSRSFDRNDGFRKPSFDRGDGFRKSFDRNDGFRKPSFDRGDGFRKSFDRNDGFRKPSFDRESGARRSFDRPAEGFKPLFSRNNSD
ncbi:P-loop containing nucleoside triphosphate hydrolase protein [Syncephalis fuscata]|nr:P-loop containing nucleoside triphosphate hydrolase protein [Syncephalis fuscata]